MELKLSLGQSHRLEQRLSQQQRAELRMEMTQRIQHEFLEHRDDVVGSPEELLKTVIANALACIENDTIRTALEAVFEDPRLQEEIMNRRQDLMRPTPEKIQDCVLKYFYEAHRGAFHFAEEGEEGRGAIAHASPHVVEVSFHQFVNAIQDPQSVQEELDLLVNLMKEGLGGVDIEHQSELRNAQAIAHASQEHVQLLEQALTHLLQVRDPAEPDAEPILRQFLMETVIFEKVLPTISERIQKRFTSAFTRAKRGEGERLHHAFLNSVGEYVLVSSGVLDPELFQLQKKLIDEEDASGIRENLASIGVRYDVFCKQYALNASGKRFWNRWKTREVAPGPETDERVRDFITRAIRTEKEALLEAADYDDLFERVCEAKEASPVGSLERRAQLQDDLRTIFVDTMTKESFSKVIKRLMVTRWYPEIERLMKPSVSK